MANKQSASNQVVRAILQIIGEKRELEVRGTEPGELRGKKLREALIEEFSNTCAYCENKITGEPDVDHLVSMNQTSVGLHMYGNLVLACKPCNAAKHSKSLSEFLRANPHLNGAKIEKKLTERAEKYGASFDEKHVEALRAFIAEAYSQIGELVSEKVDEGLAKLGKQKTPVQKSAHDFSAVAKAFPIGTNVISKVDGLGGEVYGYAMEGPKGKRTPYVRFHEEFTGRRLTRSPKTLEVEKSASSPTFYWVEARDVNGQIASAGRVTSNKLDKAKLLLAAEGWTVTVKKTSKS